MDDDKGSRVLVDVATDGGEFEREILERLGHPVSTCPGPRIGEVCPILYGQGCPKFEGAHGIVFELDLDRSQHRAILGQYRALRRDGLPIRRWCARIKPDGTRNCWATSRCGPISRTSPTSTASPPRWSRSTASAD
jgi:hypothetical protein